MEYVRRYGVDNATLRDFREIRLRLSLEKKPDYPLFETIPFFWRALIAAKLAGEANADYWGGFSLFDGKYHKLKADCGLLVVAYPNSSEKWNPVKKVWYGGVSAVDSGDATVDSYTQQVAETRQEFSVA